MRDLLVRAFTALTHPDFYTHVNLEIKPDILIKEDAQFLRFLAVKQITRLKIMFVQYFPVLSLDIFNHLSYLFQFKIFTVVKSKVKVECSPQGICIEGFLLSKTNISRKTLDPCSSAKQR